MKRAQKIFALVFVALLVNAGCKKNAGDITASIVGSWSLTSVNERLYVGNSVIVDTTLSNYNSSPVDITFLANGFYTTLSNGQLKQGVYTFSGSTLRIFDTTYAYNYWYSLHVSKLDAHNFSFLDTTEVLHDTVGVLTENFTR
jgi:hypothetical protein